MFEVLILEAGQAGLVKQELGRHVALHRVTYSDVEHVTPWTRRRCDPQSADVDYSTLF